MGIGQGCRVGEAASCSKLLAAGLGLCVQLRQAFPALLLQQDQQQAVAGTLDVGACTMTAWHQVSEEHCTY